MAEPPRGKIAAATGGASGIGLAGAAATNAAGARVAVVDRANTLTGITLLESSAGVT